VGVIEIAVLVMFRRRRASAELGMPDLATRFCDDSARHQTGRGE
jgi:hypothetical protein